MPGVQEFKACLRSEVAAELKLSRQDINTLLTEVDADGNGLVDYEVGIDCCQLVGVNTTTHVPRFCMYVLGLPKPVSVVLVQEFIPVAFNILVERLKASLLTAEAGTAAS
jgi:hypothetical protein